MERPPANSRTRGHAALAVILAALALAAAGCSGALGYTSAKANKQNGKKLFLNGAKGNLSCGSCHALADAGTTANLGPSLDVAFRQALKTGMTEATVRQVVRGQIAFAITDTSTGCQGMPKNLVTGNDARDVAAYVASAVVKDQTSNVVTPPPAPCPTPAPAPTPTPAPSGGGTQTGGSAAQLAAGKKVFLGLGGCGSCHTLKAAGSAGTVGPKLDNVAADAKTAGKALEAYILESIENPSAYVVPGFPNGVMPPDFKTTLTATQIADLVAYIVAVAGK